MCEHGSRTKNWKDKLQRKHVSTYELIVCSCPKLLRVPKEQEPRSQALSSFPPLSR